MALTAARGRGKSAALGLAVAGAVAFGYRLLVQCHINKSFISSSVVVNHLSDIFCSYSNIFVTSPSPDNLQTMFEFIFKGFDALSYQVDPVSIFLVIAC